MLLCGSCCEDSGKMLGSQAVGLASFTRADGLLGRWGAVLVCFFFACVWVFFLSFFRVAIYLLERMEAHALASLGANPHGMPNCLPAWVRRVHRRRLAVMQRQPTPRVVNALDIT